MAATKYKLLKSEKGKPVTRDTLFACSNCDEKVPRKDFLSHASSRHRSGTIQYSAEYHGIS